VGGHGFPGTGHLLAALAVLAALCSPACKAEEDVPPLTSQERLRLLDMSPMPPPVADPSNKWAADPAAAKLGKELFFDTRMSANGEVSCASCHAPETYFTDGKKLGEGVGTAGRNTPTVLGAASSPWQFWDGRADSLWAQALGPIESPAEHGSSRLAVAQVIHEHYRPAYEAIFGALPDLGDNKRFPTAGRPVVDDRQHPHQLAWAAMAEADRQAVDAIFANVGKAIAAYEHLLVPGVAPFDRHVAAVRDGDDSGGGHLGVAARRGLKLFLDDDSGCTICHFGPTLSNEAFSNIGLKQPTWAPAKDEGRYQGVLALLGSDFNCFGPHSDLESEQCERLIHLTVNEFAARGSFKVPTLRNVSETAPYMHAGHLADLAAVIEHYANVEDREPGSGVREPFLRSQSWTGEQKADLKAFLESLTAPPPAPMFQ